MLAYTYFGKGDFRLVDKPVPQLACDTDALVRITLVSICTSDLHILHGSVPRAVPVREKAALSASQQSLQKKGEMI